MRARAACTCPRPHSNCADCQGNGTIGLNFGAPLIPVGARVEGSINGFNAKGSGSGSLRVLSGTANAIVGLGMPYLIGGMGYYNATVKSGIAGIGDVTESGAGFN